MLMSSHSVSTRGVEHERVRFGGEQRGVAAQVHQAPLQQVGDRGLDPAAGNEHAVPGMLSWRVHAPLAGVRPGEVVVRRRQASAVVRARPALANTCEAR